MQSGKEVIERGIGLIREQLPIPKRTHAIGTLGTIRAIGTIRTVSTVLAVDTLVTLVALGTIAAVLAGLSVADGGNVASRERDDVASILAGSVIDRKLGDGLDAILAVRTVSTLDRGEELILTLTRVALLPDDERA